MSNGKSWTRYELIIATFLDFVRITLDVNTSEAANVIAHHAAFIAISNDVEKIDGKTVEEHAADLFGKVH